MFRDILRHPLNAHLSADILTDVELFQRAITPTSKHDQKMLSGWRKEGYSFATFQNIPSPWREGLNRLLASGVTGHCVDDEDACDTWFQNHFRDGKLVVRREEKMNSKSRRQLAQATA